jgi:hypothetical protein
VFKGAGTDSGANAGESEFNSASTNTAPKSPRSPRAETRCATTGSAACSTTTSRERFGPENGALVNAVLIDPVNNRGQGVVGYQATLDDAIRSTSDLAKLRYRFSDATSITAAHVGFQGVQNPPGIVYVNVWSAR